MNSGLSTIPLSFWDLNLAAALVIALGVTSYLMKLGVEWKLAVAAIRTAVQLSLIGMVLTFVFDHSTPSMLVLISTIMILAAGREVLARQKRCMAGFQGYFLSTFSIFLSTLIVTLFALIVVIGPQPWYTPRYAIPLLGMMLGNAMNGIAISMDRMTSAVWEKRAIIEQRLMLGMTSAEAVRDITRDCVRSGLIPAINSMAAAGLISLPGMMTGQILGGNPPLEAVKYQIIIMFMVSTNVGFGSITAVWLSRKVLFDHRHRPLFEKIGN